MRIVYSALIKVLWASTVGMAAIFSGDITGKVKGALYYFWISTGKSKMIIASGILIAAIGIVNI